MSAIQFLLQAAIIFSAIFLLYWYFSKTKPIEVTEYSGKIQPSKIVSILCVIAALIMLLGGIWTLSTNNDWFTGTILGFLGFCAVFAMSPAIWGAQDVTWNVEGVSGPTGKFFPHIMSKKITISWNEIARHDESWSNYMFLEDESGRRIFWGYWYGGEKTLRIKVIEALSTNQ